MKENIDNRTMLTDLYQLTMGAAYFEAGRQDDVATFDMFMRGLPKDWGYFVACGIEDAIDIATNLKFEDDDLDYLRELEMFKENYLTYLKNLKFSGDIFSIKESLGEVVLLRFFKATAPQSRSIRYPLEQVLRFNQKIITA